MTTFWVGNQPNPDDRTPIQVNRSCAAMIERATQRALRGEHFELAVRVTQPFADDCDRDMLAQHHRGAKVPQ